MLLNTADADAVNPLGVNIPPLAIGEGENGDAEGGGSGATGSAKREVQIAFVTGSARTPIVHELVMAARPAPAICARTSRAGPLRKAALHKEWTRSFLT